MKEVHQGTAQREARNPVILIHGFMGAKLQHARTQRSVWGRVRNLFLRGKGDDLALPIDQQPLLANRDNLVAYEICDSVGGVDFYSPIVRALRDVAGYDIGDIEHPHPGENLYVFAYDWRRDNVESAQALGEAIERIVEAHGRPDLKIDLVAHSMGGLVARYYVAYGTEDVLERDPLPAPTYAGARHIDKLVLIGTPNEGSLTAFRVMHLGITRSLSAQALFTMPSIYQLFPGKDAKPFVDARGNTLPLNLYDADNWVRYGWSAYQPHVLAQMRSQLPRRERKSAEAFQTLREQMYAFLKSALERADLFHQALSRADGQSVGVRFYSFGSDCIPTQARAVLLQEDGVWKVAFSAEEMHASAAHSNLLQDLLFAPGDGSVTLASLLAQDPTTSGFSEPSVAFTHTVFLCEQHGFLTRNAVFQNNLFHVLANEPVTSSVETRPRAAR
jgi:pimeloyl-ACP methyl ester carboxylesterase